LRTPRGLESSIYRARNGNLLDAYSQTVAGVAETVGPSVVRVEGAGPHRRGGIGSGVAISDDGLVLTNSHVVAGARRLRLSFSEAGETEAFALGDDPDTDLALLRAELPRGVTAARLGDSKLLRRGHLVIAIGVNRRAIFTP
jgi:S1-C subfamily serine protease